MLWTIAVVLIILWMLGLATGFTMGNFTHIQLVTYQDTTETVIGTGTGGTMNGFLANDFNRT